MSDLQESEILNFKCFVRVRPTTVPPADKVTIDVDGTTLTVGQVKYRPDEIWKSGTSNKDVFSKFWGHAEQYLSSGRHVALVVFGRSGSGKTYTISGAPRKKSKSLESSTVGDKSPRGKKAHSKPRPRPSMSHSVKHLGLIQRTLGQLCAYADPVTIVKLKYEVFAQQGARVISTCEISMPEVSFVDADPDDEGSKVQDGDDENDQNDEDDDDQKANGASLSDDHSRVKKEMLAWFTRANSVRSSTNAKTSVHDNSSRSIAFVSISLVRNAVDVTLTFTDLPGMEYSRQDDSLYIIRVYNKVTALFQNMEKEGKAAVMARFDYVRARDTRTVEEKSAQEIVKRLCGANTAAMGIACVDFGGKGAGHSKSTLAQAMTFKGIKVTVARAWSREAQSTSSSGREGAESMVTVAQLLAENAALRNEIASLRHQLDLRDDQGADNSAICQGLSDSEPPSKSSPGSAATSEYSSIEQMRLSSFRFETPLQQETSPQSLFVDIDEPWMPDFLEDCVDDSFTGTKRESSDKHDLVVGGIFEAVNRGRSGTSIVERDIANIVKETPVVKSTSGDLPPSTAKAAPSLTAAAYQSLDTMQELCCEAAASYEANGKDGALAWFEKNHRLLANIGQNGPIGAFRK